MTKKITGAEFSLSKIFSSDFDYVIPPYQRPYAWKKEQAEELFDDLYDFYKTEQDDSYFLGSIVLIKDENKPHAEVIDGQQRLTSLTILLSVIASQFTDEGLKSSFLKYIREPGNPFEGLPCKPRLELRARDKEFFAKYIQDIKLSDLAKLDAQQLQTESQQNIKENAQVFLSKIQEKFSNNIDMLCKFGGFLVSRCFLVAVSTSSPQSAFRVFSVLNSRGLDLLPTDIIKSDVIGRIQEEKQREKFNEQWEELEVRTGRDGFAELFGHTRMVYAKSKAKRALLEEFKEHVISRFPTSEALIEQVIEPFAEAYLVAKKMNYVATSNAENINTLLAWLNRIDNSDWLPTAILFLSQKSNQPEYVEWFIQRLERLAAYLHVTGKNVNERIERYAKVIEALQSGEHSLDAPIDTIELNLAEQQEMYATLNGDIYTMSARRRNYIILRLDSFMSDGGAKYNSDVLTIEHVLPQTVDDSSEWAQTWPIPEERLMWVHKIANLLPLNQKRNSQAQNYDFNKKKTAYFGGSKHVSSYVITTKVLDTPEWTEKVVRNKQKELLGVFADKWNLSVDGANILSSTSSIPILNTQTEHQDIVENGVVRPGAGTETGKVWEICDVLYAQTKHNPERKDVLAEAENKKINSATAATQYARWRKFHGF